MKRLAIITLMLIASFSLSAQIIVKSTDEKIEKIATARMGAVSLHQHGVDFLIMMNTTNKFDTPMVIYLGNTPVTAQQAIKDLYGLFSTLKKGGSVTIDNRGEDCKIQMDMGTLTFHMHGYAGYGSLTKSELDKFHSAMSHIK